MTEQELSEVITFVVVSAPIVLLLAIVIYQFIKMGG